MCFLPDMILTLKQIMQTNQFHILLFTHWNLKKELFTHDGQENDIFIYQSPSMQTHGIYIYKSPSIQRLLIENNSLKNSDITLICRIKYLQVYTWAGVWNRSELLSHKRAIFF